MIANTLTTRNNKSIRVFNRFRIIRMMLALTIIVCASSIQNAQAVETQMIVELHKKIQNNIVELQNTNRTLATDNAHFTEERKQISTEFATTNDRNDRRYLLKHGLAVRAKSLLATAKGIKAMQATMEEVIDDLEQLERINESAGANGISAKSENHKVIAKNLMVGLKGLAKTITSLNPTSEEMNSIRDKLAYTDAAYRAIFNTGNTISVNKQIEFLEDHHSTLAAAINLIDREKINLRNLSNLILQGEISDGIMELDYNIAPIYESIMSGNDEMLTMVNTVNNGPGAPRRKSKIRDISHIGEGY